MGEAQAFMQLDARGVRRVDAADHDVVVLLRGRRHQGFEQCASVAPAPETRLYIYGVFDRVLVSGPRAERAVAAETHERACSVFDADDGVTAFVLRFEPAHHGLGRPGLVVVQRRRVRDRFVEDVEYRCRVALGVAADEFHDPPWMYFANSPLDIVSSR